MNIWQNQVNYSFFYDYFCIYIYIFKNYMFFKNWKIIFEYIIYNKKLKIYTFC